MHPSPHSLDAPGSSPPARPSLGLALGGGSARGWAHIGVLAELGNHGIAPDIVCGTSIGALVGGIYAAGKLRELEAWVRRLTRRNVFTLLDFTMAGGGAIGGTLPMLTTGPGTGQARAARQRPMLGRLPWLAFVRRSLAFFFLVFLDTRRTG